MLMEVYYEHYSENCRDRYWEIEDKSIPYMVIIRDKEDREAFKSSLQELGLQCVAWNGDYPGVLVNMKLMRFGMIEKACKHSCVDDRNFSRFEFTQEILKPWINKSCR